MSDGQPSNIPDSPEAGLPVIEFKRVWHKKMKKCVYIIKIFHTDFIAIPVAIRDRPDGGVGVVMQLRDGYFITQEDLRVLVTEACGYIFDVVNPAGMENDPKTAAALKKIIDATDGGRDIEGLKIFEDKDFTLNKIEKKEFKDRITDLKAVIDAADLPGIDAEPEEEPDEDPDLERKAL